MSSPPLRLDRSVVPPAVVLAGMLVACGGAGAPAATETPIQAVPFNAVKITDAFWQPRLNRNRTVTIRHILDQNEASGRVSNFRRAARQEEGPFVGHRYDDSDVYKSIEAASYALAQAPDPQLEERLDALIAVIAAAQEPDGYLYTARTIDPAHPAPGAGPERFVFVHSNSHELYNAGHLIEAAVAHYQATGKRSLLDVATKLADLIDRTYGPDKRHDVPGHEEIELALVKLADTTGESRYLDLARFFLDQRGRAHDTPPEPEDSQFARYDVPIYRQDHEPVTEQREAVGHAVRAMYLYTGMADVAAHERDTGYGPALDALWQDVVGRKLYLTGGIGAQDSFESFGEAYGLPNQTAYAETCAAVGLELWNHRMFLRSGDVRYADVMERILYNGSISGVSFEGDLFFYTNPLESSGDTERRPYFGTACCPGNLARLLGVLPGYMYATRGDVLFVNLFIGSEARIHLPGDGDDAPALAVTQETRYPWDGHVRLTLDPGRRRELELRIRIPGWARGEPVPTDLYTFADPAPAESATAVLAATGESLPVRDGYATLRRAFAPGDTIEIDLPMPVRRVRANEQVEADRGRVALERGPVVYAFEAVDNGGTVASLALPDDSLLSPHERPQLLGGIVTLDGTGLRSSGEATAEPVDLVAIPYFAWANRGKGEMAVWLPRAPAAH